MYRLKSNVPDFEIVDGKFEGRKYRGGETYQEIPPEETNKFELIVHSSKTDSKETTSDEPSTKKDEGGKKR